MRPPTSVSPMPGRQAGGLVCRYVNGRDPQAPYYDCADDRARMGPGVLQGHPTDATSDRKQSTSTAHGRRRMSRANSSVGRPASALRRRGMVREHVRPCAVSQRVRGTQPDAVRFQRARGASTNEILKSRAWDGALCHRYARQVVERPGSAAECGLVAKRRSAQEGPVSRGARRLRSRSPGARLAGRAAELGVAVYERTCPRPRMVVHRASVVELFGCVRA
jgi:hypothetical protein